MTLETQQLFQAVRTTAVVLTAKTSDEAAKVRRIMADSNFGNHRSGIPLLDNSAFLNNGGYGVPDTDVVIIKGKEATYNTIAGLFGQVFGIDRPTQEQVVRFLDIAAPRKRIKTLGPLRQHWEA